MKNKETFKNEGKLTIDSYETSSHFVVLSAIAGVSNENIDISVDKDMLIIKGYRKNPKEEKEERFFNQECYWGPFSRKIILPENINSSKIEASIKRGILKISFPKIQKTKSKKVNLKN